MNGIRVSNGLDPNQDRRSVGPDLGPNCFKSYQVAASIETVKVQTRVHVPRDKMLL